MHSFECLQGFRLEHVRISSTSAGIIFTVVAVLKVYTPERTTTVESVSITCRIVAPSTTATRRDVAYTRTDENSLGKARPERCSVM